jgi:hypothetical protein
MAIEVVIPEHCCFDLEPAVVTSTSTVPASILSACVVRDGYLDLTSPTTCLSLCPGGNTSAVAATMMASVVLGEPVVTTACRTREICIYPVAHLVVTPIPAIVDVADCAPAVVLTQATLGNADSSGRI